MIKQVTKSAIIKSMTEISREVKHEICLQMR